MGALHPVPTAASPIGRGCGGVTTSAVVGVEAAEGVRVLGEVALRKRFAEAVPGGLLVGSVHRAEQVVPERELGAVVAADTVDVRGPVDRVVPAVHLRTVDDRLQPAAADV